MMAVISVHRTPIVRYVVVRREGEVLIVCNLLGKLIETEIRVRGDEK